MARRITASSETKKLRDKFLRDLEREGEHIVKQLTQQFLRELQSQSEKLVGEVAGRTS